MFSGTARITLSTTVLSVHRSSMLYAMALMICRLGRPVFFQRVAKTTFDIPVKVFSEGQRRLAICTFGNGLKQLIATPLVHRQSCCLSTDTQSVRINPTACAVVALFIATVVDSSYVTLRGDNDEFLLAEEKLTFRSRATSNNNNSFRLLGWGTRKLNQEAIRHGQPTLQ
jgi:hypothetical protein